MLDSADGQYKGTVLVSGASSGIGLATARRCAADGWRVIAAARRMERLEDLAAELGPACRVLPLDLRQADMIQQAIMEIEPPFDRIDVLINSAGIFKGDGRTQDLSLDELRATIDTNIVGLVALTHAVLPQMVARRSGDIVNIGSIAASYPFPTSHVYGASKAFVRQFTLNLRADLIGLGIRAMCIEPGTTRSEFAVVRMNQDVDRANAMFEGRRPLTPDDVADVICFSIGMPRHVNLNIVEMMPTDQASAAPAFVEFAGARDG